MFFSASKAFLLFFACAFISTFAAAQQFQISESEIDIKGVPRKGQQLLVQLDKKVVKKAWENHLREKAGKIVSPITLPKNQLSKGVSVIEKAKIDSISPAPMRIISKVEDTPAGTTVWWTLDLGNAYVSKDGTPQQYAAAETFLKDFARKIYSDDIKQQVTEAEKAWQNAQNEHNRVVKQVDDLNKNLDRNAARKRELEVELERNVKEHEQITADIANNLKQQEAAQKEVENMQKAVEVIKAKTDKLQ